MPGTHSNSGCNLLRARTKAQEHVGVIHSTCTVDLSHVSGLGRYSSGPSAPPVHGAWQRGPPPGLPREKVWRSRNHDEHQTNETAAPTGGRSTGLRSLATSEDRILLRALESSLHLTQVRLQAADLPRRGRVPSPRLQTLSDEGPDLLAATRNPRSGPRMRTTSPPSPARCPRGRRILRWRHGPLSIALCSESDEGDAMTPPAPRWRRACFRPWI
jgi:hypothetical protein